MALAKGISTFDTAPDYGESEVLLGEFFNGKANKAINPVIMTKLPKRIPGVSLHSFIAESINKSRSKLGLEKINYYLLHDPEDVYNKDLINILVSYKEKGLINELGASVYSLKEALAAIDNGIKVLQVPINIFDHRFTDHKFLNTCRQNDILLIARSIFLQGLFFCDPGFLPQPLNKAKMFLHELYNISRYENIPVHELAIKFVFRVEEINHAVIGSDSTEQLEDNVNASEGPELPETLCNRLKENFKDIPREITDPRFWKKEK